MLIVNKKFSNLLDGYHRAQELDQELKATWESKYRPAILARLEKNVSEMMKKYDEDLLSWQKREQESIAKWEAQEKEKMDTWEANENIRLAANSTAQAQHAYQITQRKQITQQWMIAWICSSITFFFLLLLIVLLSTRNTFIYVPCAIGTMVTLVASIITFIKFMVNCCSKNKPFYSSVPAPKPLPTTRYPEKEPVKPMTAEDLINKQSPPKIVARWMREIQYKNDGLEYFTKLNRENPEVANGIAGEISLLKTHLKLDDPTNPIIYIPGLKTQRIGDMDGIAILPQGLWILESKYLTGRVELHDGVWKQFTFKKYDGQPYLDGWEEKMFDKPFNPENQLEGHFGKIKRILSKFSRENPWINNAINAVLVFTNSNIDLDISNCRVLFVELKELEDIYAEKIDIKDMTPEKRFEIADILLSINRKIEKEQVSAVQLAEKIYEDSVDFMEKFSRSGCLE